MDDFLYNLRRETDKRNRRQGSQQNYRGPDRRNMKDQRRGFVRRNDAMDQLTELLPEIKSILETIDENQKRFIADEKRKTLVFENIAASLRMISGNTQPLDAPDDDIEPVEEAAMEPQETAPSETNNEIPADETSSEAKDVDGATEKLRCSNREDIRKIALELRAQGKTYKQIAQHLDDEHIPTFSGKGGWHAPTIHKLCK